MSADEEGLGQLEDAPTPAVVLELRRIADCCEWWVAAKIMLDSGAALGDPMQRNQLSDEQAEAVGEEFELARKRVREIEQRLGLHREPADAGGAS